MALVTPPMSPVPRQSTVTACSMISGSSLCTEADRSVISFALADPLTFHQGNWQPSVLGPCRRGLITTTDPLKYLFHLLNRAAVLHRLAVSLAWTLHVSVRDRHSPGKNKFLILPFLVVEVARQCVASSLVVRRRPGVRVMHRSEGS